ncbi:MAG: GTPase HflX [Gemmatimonadales bacterium]
MIEVQPPIERAILVGTPRKGSKEVVTLQEHLDELERLVDTAGAQIVGRLTQQLASASPATLIGEGKVEELRALILETGATLVVFDEELTPNQGATLEEELKKRVMDRAELILDIFATRARSHEAKLQVELAQNKYLLPRLARMWTHLSRIRGGIGLRGPGETQLETDRRLLRKKIQHLTIKLKDVGRHRATLRAGRRPMLDAALVGYTNAGKSSVMRSLSGEHDIFVEDRLFATLDTLSREIDLGDGYRCRLFDTVGFIRKLPHNLVASFRATLEEVVEADLLLHIVDASHPEWEEQWDVVEGVLAELGVHDVPVVPVFNKMDMVEDPVSFAQRARELHPEAIFTSTIRIDGVEQLKAELRRREREASPPVVLRIPMADGKRMAEIYRAGEVLKREVVGEEYEVTVRIPAGEATRLGTG